MTSDDLYERLLVFAKRNQKVIKKLPLTVYNREYCEQLIRSSGSPGANYVEAIEAGSKKEFIYRLIVCRKETKESVHWLLLIQNANDDLEGIQEEVNALIREARELIRIFTASILTAQKNKN
jgi:four helix bundle protein